VIAALFFADESTLIRTPRDGVEAQSSGRIDSGRDLDDSGVAVQLFELTLEARVAPPSDFEYRTYYLTVLTWDKWSVSDVWKGPMGPKARHELRVCKLTRRCASLNQNSPPKFCLEIICRSSVSEANNEFRAAPAVFCHNFT
jgi:hypothetical protein